MREGRIDEEIAPLSRHGEAEAEENFALSPKCGEIDPESGQGTDTTPYSVGGIGLYAPAGGEIPASSFTYCFA